MLPKEESKCAQDHDPRARKNRKSNQGGSSDIIKDRFAEIDFVKEPRISSKQKKPGSREAHCAQGGKFDRALAKHLKDNKLKNFRKQEKEIFDPDFDLKKSKTLQQRLYKQDGYTNDAKRPYDDDEDSADETLDDMSSPNELYDELDSSNSDDEAFLEII